MPDLPILEVRRNVNQQRPFFAWPGGQNVDGYQQLSLLSADMM